MLYVDEHSHFVGYCEAMEDIMGWLNSLDTEDYSIKELRSAIYSFAMAAKPKNGK